MRIAVRSLKVDAMSIIGRGVSIRLDDASSPHRIHGGRG